MCLRGKRQRFQDVLEAARGAAGGEAEELGARTLSAYLLTRIDGAVTTTRVASAVQGDWLLVTLSAECLEQIGETVPILTD